jgi:26S proteasome regulatory subunit N7
MGSDPQYNKYPDLSLAQDIFLLTSPSSSKPAPDLSPKLQDAIAQYKMAPLYRHLAHPEDGLLNASGEGSAQKPAHTGVRKSSDAANL